MVFIVVLVAAIVVLVLLGFELRSSHLLGRCSTTWVSHAIRQVSSMWVKYCINSSLQLTPIQQENSSSCVLSKILTHKSWVTINIMGIVCYEARDNQNKWFKNLVCKPSNFLPSFQYRWLVWDDGGAKWNIILDWCQNENEFRKVKFSSFQNKIRHILNSATTC
jgi:hypothetical protein